MDGQTTVAAVLADVARRPRLYFVTHWNWKSSVFSAVCRSAIFFATNMPAGTARAAGAMATEFVFRAIASGLLGSLTQALRHSEPRIAALVMLPALGHLAEYAVHSLAGTPRLGTSVAASVAFSVLTTAFNLFAMRRGALLVGTGQQPFRTDMMRLPALIAAFAGSLLPGRSVNRRTNE